jgi:hypothetical protein
MAAFHLIIYGRFCVITEEIVAIVWGYREERKAWRRGKVLPPDKPSVAKFWFEIVATVLVVAGVFGEAGAGEALASINSQLRSKTSELRGKGDQLLALITLEAGNAKTSADKAADATHRAEQSATDAGVKAHEVKERVDAIGKRASGLDKELASVQHGLTLRLSREGVFVKKTEDFERALRPFAGQKVDVRYAANLEDPTKPYDPETYWFAAHLSFTLGQAHWLSPDALRDVPAEHGTGVFISVSPRSSQRTRDAAEALANALVAVPIEVRPAIKGRGLSTGSLVSTDAPNRLPQPATALYPPFDDETIVVEVGPHP